MSRNYDNWERLLGAVLRREKDRRLAYCESLSSSSSADVSLRCSFVGDVDESDDVSIFFSRNKVKAMEYEEIRKATGSFREENKLGGRQNRPNRVYKGWIDENYVAALTPESGILVAVTVHRHPEGLAYWLAQSINLCQFRNPNLVTPIGYYIDHRDTSIFVNEFMARGSLDGHLFSRDKNLPWATRIKVVVGAARGLAFLHNLAEPVTYGVLMSDDILLDADFNAKLSGLKTRGHLVESIMGEKYDPYASTMCDEYDPYAPPEFKYTGGRSTKSDVYGFGLVLLELLSGFRVFDTRRPNKMHNLMHWAKPYLGSKRRLSLIMDSRLEGQYPPNEAYEVAKIGLKCVSSNPGSRPNMVEVITELENL